VTERDRECVTERARECVREREKERVPAKRLSLISPLDRSNPENFRFSLPSTVYQGYG
jgi:hypothetical protein